MTRDLRTPCCGTSFYPHLGFEGSGFLEYQVVESYGCNNCHNEWWPDGVADPYNKYPDETEES